MAVAIGELRRAPAAAQSPLVPLQPGGSLPPLFIVHASDRGVMGYVNIVRHLGADQPVFGLQDVGEDLGRPLARIAAEYVEAIRTVQPEGPYHLAGWSFGGFVAYEMAVQLEAAGQEVAFVGLLDSMSPAVLQAWPWNTDADLVAALAADISSRRGRACPVTADELRGMEFEEQVRTAAGALRDQGSVPADFADATLRAQCQVVRDRLSALDGYQPGTCTATLTLFRAEDVPERQVQFLGLFRDEEERTLGWSAVSPNSVQVHTVPGTHASITAEPNVRVLVERMRESLEAARRGADVRPAASEPGWTETLSPVQPPRKRRSAAAA
jgi:thioesterase domain-containing protein